MQNINNEYENIAKSKGEIIQSYTELLEKVSDLAYDFPKHILYFRGQKYDYTTLDGRTTLYPSIYRGFLSKDEIKGRFKILEGSSKALIDVSKKYSLKGISEMRKKKQILWSILQHYEICDTPLLDITHSLRTACSFALENNDDYGYVYVLAMPYLTNRITYNSEEDLLLVRLLSISPPAAKRPFYQDGYVVGTPDVTDNYERKNELDVVNRLVSKFKINNSQMFWGNVFSPLSNEFMYPSDDTFRQIQQEVIELRNRGFYDNTIGDFLKLWNELERVVKGRSNSTEYASINVAYKLLSDSSELLKKYHSQFDKVRQFRNDLVHGKTKGIDELEIEKNIIILRDLLDVIDQQS
ncbi:FRG domain-containing protein [Fusibacter sp. 3D3]|uniref:FRG domain-containing protein n=1 Tax=Fusibacter sp. 3D3 TaxID=1048380 RepID=UPI00085316E8|nr:FRG domain-containing protein [Fusibacter sp. 3D3]GAU78499.1 hypothetical protein F3D3_3133 [Fusibacter sp. 3D3]